MSLTKLLASPADIAGLKEFDLSTRQDKINPHIIDAQMQDVSPLLGERLYNDVIKNTSNYTDLLDFGYYTYQGNEYVNYGLKNVIALYAYARFAYMGSATPTPYGIVQKKNPNASDEIDTSSKKVLFLENQKQALNLWQSVESYLVRNQIPLYKTCQVEDTTQNTGSYRFETISRDCN